MLRRDFEALRRLADEYAEICAKPFNAEYKRLWYKLNGLKAERPMYIIDELPWHELNADGELTLVCEDRVCRMIEQDLRQLLYRYRHLHDDFVFEPYYYMPKKITGCAFALEKGLAFDMGVDLDEETTALDANNSVLAHAYHDQFEHEDDLEKLKVPDVHVDAGETALRESIAKDAIGDILEVRMDGFTPFNMIWDVMVMVRSLENLMCDMIVNEELIHKTIRRLMDIHLGALKQLDDQSLLSWPQRQVHCCGAWTDELPDQPNEQGGFKAKDVWTYGMAQILYTISPQKHNEYEFEYAKEWYSKFGLGYYGCCEPLEDRLEYVKKIPNIRKISASAWVKDYDSFSEQLEQRYVMSFKPSPANILSSGWNPEALEKQLSGLRNSADKFGNCCEFTLKDISTCEYNPARISEWSSIMRKIVER
jgi:hypothetical protein